MKLDYAIKVADLMTVGLAGEQRAAVTALVELAKRVNRTRGPVRDLAKAIYGDELNQADLFGETEGEKR